jgi:TonB family protein
MVALALVLVAAAVVLGWFGSSIFRTDPTSGAAAIEATKTQSPASVPRPIEAAPVVSDEALPKPATETAVTKSTEVEPRSTKATSVESEVPKQPVASSSPTNEVIPDVPRSASQTIRGTIRVSVRVIVGKDGTVLDARADEPGPSRYFARLATEASKKWRFAPSDSEAQRIMLVRFYFKRDGTTARASSPK